MNKRVSNNNRLAELERPDSHRVVLKLARKPPTADQMESNLADRSEPMLSSAHGRSLRTEGA